MKLPELLKLFAVARRQYQKQLFSVAELALLAGESHAATGMGLRRAAAHDLLGHVGFFWFLASDPPTIEVLALALRSPSYISFESALYHHGILSQSPRGHLTVAVTGRPGVTATPLGNIAWIHLKSSLLWGFDAQRMADPEKAYVDLLYIRSKQGRLPLTEVLYTDELDAARLTTYAKQYPRPVQNEITAMQSQ